MNSANIRQRRRRERGIAAVEAAVAMVLLILCLAVPLFLARIFWYYSVAQKAAHDAARFLSTASRVEMLTLGPGFEGAAPIADVARDIVLAEIAEIRPQLDAWAIDVQCDLTSCGMTVPKSVRVQVRIRIHDAILPAITDEFFYNQGNRAVNMTANVTMNYVGR